MFFRYKPSFVRQLNKLPTAIQDEVFEKLELFKNVENHQKLKVHKLKGKLQSFYSFSVNYSHRIVFAYETKNDVVFISIGDHDIYS
jgi:plasmid maintenance system killer protein